MILALLVIIAASTLTTAICAVLLMLRLRGVNLPSMERDIYELWLKRKADERRLGV